jgi:hypothetical protein
LEHQFLTPTEVASRLRVSAKTLANWRSQNKGPPHTKLGGRILYASAELDRHLNGSAVRNLPRSRQAQKIADACHDERFLEFLSGLSRRAQTVLRNHPINSFNELLALRPDDLKGKLNCGARTIEEILVAARSHKQIETQKGLGPLDRELARLVKRYGLRPVLASIAKHAPEC